MRGRIALMLVTLLLVTACAGDSSGSAPAATPQSTRDVLASPAAETMTAAPATSEPPGARSSPTPYQDYGVPSIEGVYIQLTDTLNRPNEVLHVTQQIDSDAGLYSFSGTVEQWVDVAGAVAREEVRITIDGREQRTDAVITTDGRYSRRPDGETQATTPRTCYAAGIAASTVLGCPGPTEVSTTTVEWTKYDGDDVLVLVKRGTSSGSDERATFRSRLYLDPRTMLPIADVTDGTLDYGETVPLHRVITYEHRFVPADSLAADFFDPASIGYAPPNLLGWLDEAARQTPIYWLGEQSTPERLPALVLGGVEVSESSSGPGYAAILHYNSAADRFGPSYLTMQEWPRAAWDAGGGASYRAFWEAKPCHGSEQIQLPDGTATIYMAYEPESPEGQATPKVCDEQSYNRFGAVADFGETVLLIDAPGWSSPANGIQHSPYNSREAMEAVVLGLVRR